MLITKRKALATSIFLITMNTQASVLEEITVTAQKKEQSLQDVSVSVTAYSGDQLDALGITETTEIIQQVPALQINAWSPNVTIFNLRGISQNNFQDNLEAPVAVYIDDAYMGSLNGISGQLFDIKRTEILRGPQGTLFGRNATGGLIHYVSNGADSEETNGYLQVGVADYSRKSIEAAVGGSLSENVRGRVAARWEQADGYIKAQIPGVRDMGGADGYAVRANFQVDFSEQLMGDFWLKYSKDDDVATGGYVFENCPSSNPPDCDVDVHGRSLVSPGTAGGDVHKHLGDLSGYLNRDTSVAQAKFTYDFSNGNELVSITNYTSIDKEYLEDGDALPLPVVVLATGVDYQQYSQEIRLSGGSENMRWQTGFYVLDMNIDGYNTVSGAPALYSILPGGRAPGADMTALDEGFPGNGFSGAVAPANWVVESKNWSVFGQVEYDFAEDFMLTVGVRWSQDDKSVDYELSYYDDYNPEPLIVETDESYDAVVPNASEIDYGDWAGRIALDYRASNDLLLFASINRGIKGGNFTLSVGDNITAENFKHDAEVIYSYELGFKADLLDADMRLNGTAFYYDYGDYQAFSLAGGAPLIANTDATVHGGELELVWTPGDHFDFNFGLSYIESEVDQITGAGAFSSASELIYDAELPNTPKFSFNYLGRYNFNLGKHNLAFQVDGVWNDDQYLEVTNGPGTVQDAYNVTNVRFVLSGGEDNSYSVSLYAKNVFDKEYKAYTLDLGTLGVTSYYAPPVTYGANFKYNF